MAYGGMESGCECQGLFPLNQRGPFAYAGTEPGREGLAVELTTK